MQEPEHPPPFSPSHSDLSSFSAPFPTHHPQLFIRRRFEQAIAVSIDFLEKNRGERLESHDEPPWLEDGADREDAQPPVLEIRDGLLVACSERHRAIDRVAAVLLQCAHETARPGQDDEQPRERPLPSSSSSATTPLSLSPVASSAVAAFKAYWSRSGPVPLPMALLWLRFCFFRGEYDYVKSALGDLAFLREQGWDHDILAHARAGGRVLGLCGGYQMLGLSISDPEGVDGEAGIVAGLGLLDVETTMIPTKRVSLVQGHCAIDGTAVSGYEIHTGVTSGAATSHPMVELRAAPDGARSADGRIEGTYIHGIFSSDDYRRCWLERCGGIAKEGLDYGAEVDSALDELAAGVSNALDVDRFLQLAQRPGWRPPAI